MTKVLVYIIEYPGVMKSSVFGTLEIFGILNQLLKKDDSLVRVEARIVKVGERFPRKQKTLEIVFIPPAIDGDFYLDPEPKLLSWIKRKYLNNGIITSSCAGAFILAHSKILTEEIVTTHWGLAEKFVGLFPGVDLNTDHIVKDEGRIITSGGLMSWQDLVFHLIKKYVSSSLINELGRYLIYEIPQREQKSFSVFQPKVKHGSSKILLVQEFIEKNITNELSIKTLSEVAVLGERTFLRRFKEVTGLKPIEYIQKIRVKNAQELLENGSLSIEEIAYTVGYNDFSSFRKVFIKHSGLSPSKFRKKWNLK